MEPSGSREKKVEESRALTCRDLIVKPGCPCCGRDLAGSQGSLSGDWLPVGES